MAYIKPIDSKSMNPDTLAFIKAMAKKAYPGYKGRKWELAPKQSYYMENYWSEGSRTYCMGINLETLEVSAPHADTTNPFKAAAGASFPMPQGFAILENIIFRGKSLGISLVIHPNETKVPGYSPALPEPVKVPEIGNV